MTEENKPKKLRVGVVFGGRSAEHEVSLRSAKAVLEALDPNKYDVTLIGITRSGRWLPLEAPSEEVDPAQLMAPFANPETTDNTTHAALLPDPSIRPGWLSRGDGCRLGQGTRRYKD